MLIAVNFEMLFAVTIFKDALALHALDASKAQVIMNEVENMKASIRKLNKKLVSNLMIWVDQSMSQIQGSDNKEDLSLESLQIQSDIDNATDVVSGYSVPKGTQPSVESNEDNGNFRTYNSECVVC